MENQINDWCRYFAAIEADPKVHPPRLTIRQLLQAQEHVAGCDNCNMRVERVLAQAPKPKFAERGMN